LITGGGAHNKFWIKKLKELKIKTVVPETKLIDFKEALIFSLLGVLKLRGEINILASVTGSSKDLSAGIIYSP
jgi:anhydro-N-acetylmuramic acid kinase